MIKKILKDKFFEGNLKMALEISHKASDVFGIGRDLPLNYVARKSVDELLVNSLTRDKHLVVLLPEKTKLLLRLRRLCLVQD